MVGSGSESKNCEKGVLKVFTELQGIFNITVSNRLLFFNNIILLVRWFRTKTYFIYAHMLPSNKRNKLRGLINIKINL